MSLDKPLEQLTEEDLRQLIEGQVPEGKCVDYKLDLPSNSDGDRKEFLADVSSFANTAGGHLIFGIAEENLLPTELAGFHVDNIDETIRRYENIIRDGLEPRVANIQVRVIPLASGNSAMVIRVPKSWNPPHMVTFKGSSKFFARNSAGKYPLDVDELRGLFLSFKDLADRTRTFRRERLSAILSAETPVAVKGDSFIVLHFVPFSFLDPSAQLDLSKETPDLASLLFMALKNIRQVKGLMNFDGRLTYHESASGAINSYIQLFRTGCLEVVDASSLNEAEYPQCLAPYFGNLLIGRTGEYLDLLAGLGVTHPITIMVSLLGIKGFRIADRGCNPLPPPTAVSIDRPNLLFPEVMVQDSSMKKEQVLRPVMDALWNACGFAKCPNYDKDGNWRD